MVPADDARHSVVGRARPLAQRSLLAFSQEEAFDLGRNAYGPCRALEIEVKSALTPCRVPGEPWSLNPYTGCAHGCLYCFVPDVAHLQRERWGSYVVVKRNLPTVLARELARKERRPVFMSSATDPYQPAERDHRITRRCLELLAKRDWPLTVLTRSPLVTRDIDLFRRFSDIEVGLSVPTLDDGARAVIEPRAPTIAARLKALRTLADAGLETYANLSPAYPLTGGVTPRDIAAAFRAAGVKLVHASAWNYLRTVQPVLRERVAGTPFEAFAQQVPDAEHHRRLMRDMAQAFDGSGVAFEVWGDAPRPGSPVAKAYEESKRAEAARAAWADTGLLVPAE